MTSDPDEYDLPDPGPEARTCFLCKRILEWCPLYGIRGGGDVALGFGYGSRHDIMSFTGVICDTCADPLKPQMLIQTRIRLAERRKELEAQGVKFATEEDMRDI